MGAGTEVSRGKVGALFMGREETLVTGGGQGTEGAWRFTGWVHHARQASGIFRGNRFKSEGWSRSGCNGVAPMKSILFRKLRGKQRQGKREKSSAAEIFKGAIGRGEHQRLPEYPETDKGMEVKGRNSDGDGEEAGRKKAWGYPSSGG